MSGPQRGGFPWPRPPHRGQGRGRGFKANSPGKRDGGGSTSSRGFWRGRRAAWRGRWRGQGRGQGRISTEDEPSPDLPPPKVTAMEKSGGSIYDPRNPYKAWKIYLPTEDYHPQTSRPIVTKLRAALKFLRRTLSYLNTEDLFTRRGFQIQLKDIIGDAELIAQWGSNLEEDLATRAEFVHGVFGLAKHQDLLDEAVQQMQKDSGNFNSDVISGAVTNLPVVRARIVGHEPLTPISALSSKNYGNLVSLRGTVIRVSNMKPICLWLAFRCTLCFAMMSVYQPLGRFVEPVKCPNSTCKSRRFTALRSHSQTITVDWQAVRLQEVVQQESGRIPSSIECELTEDLCDSVVPGDVITLTGVVKNIRLDTTMADRRGDRFISQLYVHALATVNERAKSRKAGLDNRVNAVEFTYGDCSLVQEIQSFESQILKLLVHSLCPSIYGHELVKASLLLGLFGGTCKYVSDRTHVPVRGDPHILIVGDPGLGKSQMLTSCANIAPRGVFVTGNTTTSSGLTVTMSKGTGNDFCLEAGALVLADQGVCCIDEFDKMTSQHQALLEAMEQQSISLAKAGVVCSLPARAAVLAAANPVGGHYDRSKTVSENLKLNPALLSRFDLVFILIDKPDEEWDGLLCDHIMRLHSKRSRPNESDSSSSTSISHFSVSSARTSGTDDGYLLSRLRRRRNEEINPVAHEDLRKYIAYARQYVFPKLNAEACEVLKNFYVELRQRNRHRLQQEGPPITLRQLEALARLTEARAKLELREEATYQDAVDIVEIMRASMIDTLSDETGSLDFSRSSNGSGMSSRGAARKFVQALQRHAESVSRNIFSVDEMRQVLHACGAKVANFFDFLTSLNTQGYLIKKSSKTYQLLTADY